jgi:hypothetical protein
VGVSFISTGTVEDAVGVLGTFGIDVAPESIRFEGEDSAEIDLPPGALAHTARGKLQTALECALNREIRLREIR